MNKTGKKIAMYRKQKHLTQVQLAQKCSMSKSGLSRIENGKRLPTSTELNNIGNVLGVSVAILKNDNDILKNVIAQINSVSSLLELMKNKLHDETNKALVHAIITAINDAEQKLKQII